MLALSDEDKSNILKSKDDLAFCCGKKYFIKPVAIPLMEIVLSRMAQAINMNYPKYEMVKINGLFFYLSECIDDNLKSGDILEEEKKEPLYIGDSIYRMWKFLGGMYPLYADELLMDIIKIYLFDIFTINEDRHTSNWGIKVQDGKPSLWAFDGELGFNHVFGVLLSAKVGKLDTIKKRVSLDYNKDTLNRALKYNIKDLEYFCKRYSKEFMEPLRKMYNFFAPESVKALFDNVLMEYYPLFEPEEIEEIQAMNEDRLELYRVNYELIGEILKDSHILPTISEEEKQEIADKLLFSRINGFKVSIDGRTYFGKIAQVYNGDDGLELVAEDLAYIVGINSAHYEALVMDGQLIYLSEDLNSYGNFISFKDIGINKSHSLFDIKKALEFLYPENIDGLMDEVVKVYLFDLLLMQYDRHKANWGIKFFNGVPESISILDNEKMFSKKYQPHLVARPIEDVKFVQAGKMDAEDKIIKANMQDLEYFVSNYPEKHIKTLVEMYQKLTPNVIAETFANIQNRLKRRYLRGAAAAIHLYTINYAEIGSILKSHGLIDGSKMTRKKPNN